MQVPGESNRVDVEFGKNVRAIRVQRDLSSIQLAKLCKTTPQQIQKYETGRNSPTTGRIREICIALSVTPNSLFGWGEATNDIAPTRISAWALRLAVKLDLVEDSEMKRAVVHLITIMAASSPHHGMPILISKGGC